MDQSGTFDTLTSQRVGHKETFAFSAPQAMNDEFISRGKRLKSVNAEKELGILMEVHGKIDTSIHDNGLKKFKDGITMIDTLPVPFEKKAELISLKSAGAGYGLEITKPSKEVAKAFDKQNSDKVRLICIKLYLFVPQTNDLAFSCIATY